MGVDTLIKTVLFDVDGVFLSEDRCFDASALSVWELLYSRAYLGLERHDFSPVPAEDDIRRIRKHVFADDETLNFMKDRGINSNWDMVFLTTAYQLLRLLKQLRPERPEFVARTLQHPIGRVELQAVGRAVQEEGFEFKPAFAEFVNDFSRTEAQKQEILLYLNTLAQEWIKVETNLFSRSSLLWELGRMVYQEWYLGDAYYEKAEGKSPSTPGKVGFLENEIALADLEQIRALLHDLQNRGFTLGIGTGRPYLETEVPLKTMGLWGFFASDRIVTASDVIKAEKAFPGQVPLGKPQPFTYVKGLLGRERPDEEVIRTALPVENGAEVLIVGDSVADYMAARSMGCPFAAILTGLTGQAARPKFEELKADYICDDVLGLRDVLL